MISGQTPKHLLAAARTGFLDGLKAKSYPWQRVAGTFDMTAREVDLVDLGAPPMPLEVTKGHEMQDWIEKSIAVKPKDWGIKVGISRNALADDQTGNLEAKFNQAGSNFQKHINKLVFQALNGGDGTTYGLCYDGGNFFQNSHIDDGADYQTAQDNMFGLALSLTNFDTVMVAAQAFKDDRGEYADFDYDLLVCNPALNMTAHNIVKNVEDYETANRAENAYSGKVAHLSSPHLDAAAWLLVASNESIKPIIVAMREWPNLTSTKWDPDQPEGGMHYFYFNARYDVFYGDWRLVAMGNT